jgi:pimeloyl-ACP methyl ester carboxylesterase
MSSARHTERSLNLSTAEISYLESAGDGRPIVFVHGNSSSARTWLPLIEGTWADRFRCIAVDLPGHGRSAPATDPGRYSLPGYAEVIQVLIERLGADGAILVGWSLGGHTVLEAVPDLTSVTGAMIFGAPPVGTLGELSQAFLPNPATQIGFSAEVDAAAARQYAESFLAPGSPVDPEEFVADILATDGQARSGIAGSLAQGRFRNETDVVTQLTVPLAVLHGEHEQLVNLEYLEAVSMPTLWRGRVQVIPRAGHALHREAPDAFAALLTAFAEEVGATG